MNRWDATRLPVVRTVLRNRWPQLLAQMVTLAGFVFVILAGLLGSPVGGANFAIIFVWIVWWTVLKLFFIPLGGRAWCSICPLPMPGEWLQRGALLGPRGKPRGLGWKWPARLRGSWLQAGAFAGIGLFSAVTLTQPGVTGWVLLAIIALATVTGLVFERRAFCRYLCPIGGITGLYANLAPVEVRIKDPAICIQHPEKSCYQGSAEGYGCPWGVFPAALRENSPCGLCMECLRTCPKDNIAVNIRPFGSDTGHRLSSRLDTAAFALVMLSSALVFSALFLGPWGKLKAAAYAIGQPSWMMYASAFLVFTTLILPGLFFLAVWASRRISGSLLSIRKAFATQAQALVPLGLMAWIGFTISFALIKLPVILTVLSDPLGLGWNLFGTARIAAFPDLSGFSSILEIIALLTGLFWSVRVARRLPDADKTAKPSMGQALPVTIFSLLFTFGMLWLLIG
jgi:polyferredoxin